MRPAPRSAVLAVLAAAALATGCATTAPAAPGKAAAAHPADPWEGFNRKVYAFNEAVDEAVLKPVATTYRDVVPQFVRTGVANFFGNFDDAWSAVNHLLQGKVHSGLEMGFRVVVNSTFGLGGLLDPATEMRLERRPEDLGQTLGSWGVGSGPYLMLPLLGPSTLRDGVALPADMWLSPSMLTADDGKRFAGTTLNIVETRAQLLSATQLLGDIALDRYSFVRDAFLARRLDQVWDGAPPLPPDEFVDEPASKPPAAPAPASAPPSR